MKNVNKKLETYRDLFIKSGAWQRMIDRFGVTSSGPMLVADLAKEIGLIEKWYENRFHEMDAYFGITDGIENIEYSPLNTAQAVYNLQGHRMADSTFNILHSTRKGIIILNGNKYFVR